MFTYSVHSCDGFVLIRNYTEVALINWLIRVGAPAHAWIERSDGYDVTDKYI